MSRKSRERWKARTERSMIVKVQLAQFPPDAPALIYDEGKKFFCTGNLDETALKKMKGRPKAYFHAVENRATGAIHLNSEAPAQDW